MKTESEIKAESGMKNRIEKEDQIRQESKHKNQRTVIQKHVLEKKQKADF